MHKFKHSLLSQTALVSMASSMSVALMFAMVPMAWSSSAASAAACTANANGSFALGANGAVNQTSCEINFVAPVIGNTSIWNLGFQLYSQGGKNNVMTIGSDITTTLKGTGGIAVYGATPTTLSTFDASGKTINLTIANIDANASIPAGDHIPKVGLGVSHASTAKIGTFNLTMLNLPSGNDGSLGGGRFEHYGVVTGSSVSAAETAAFNGLYSKAEFDNLDIKMSSASQAGFFPSYPLLVGIRTIQGAGGNSGNGTSGYVDVKQDLNIDLQAQQNDAIGIYISGGDSQVHLNNSNIKVTSQSTRANAIRLGKTAAIGTGSGKLYSSGAMVLDTTNAANSATIDIIWQGALLDANENSSSTTIKSAKTAIAVAGNKDQSGPAKTITSFNNLIATTTSQSANLINVANNQAEYELNVRGAQSAMTAAANGWLLNVEGATNRPSLVNFNFSEGNMQGLVNVQAASTLNLNLDKAGVWLLKEKGGTGSSTTSTFTQLNLTNNARVDAFGDFTLAGNVASTSGILNLSDGVATNTLTIKGNYVGSGNALLQLDTFLGASGSDSDRLINDGGTITGQTFVRIKNTDTADTGAETEPGHGIKIVRSINGGTTTSDAFALDGAASNAYQFSGRTVVGAGAYAYSLYKGANPASASDTDEYGEDTLENDWYLRSQLNKDEEQYTAGVPIYEAYPQLLLGLNGLPTLQQRVGNRYWNNAGNRVLTQGADAIQPYAPAEEAGVLIEENGIWGRIEGSHTKIKSRETTSGTDYDYNIFKMQAGLDGLLHETENGKLIGGVTVHYVNGSADVYSAHGDGDIKTNGYGFGGTLTWYGESGFYIDNQAQVTWYDSDLNSKTANTSLVNGNNGLGYAVSVETCKRVTLDEHWSVTPQAQLIYSNVRFDSFTDQFNGHVSKDRADSLQGRLGLSADYQNSWLNGQGNTNRSHVYGIANLYNEFLNGTKVDVSGVGFTNKQERLWAGIGLGGSYNWNDDKYSVYGEGSVNTSLKNFGDSYAFKGTVGFRVKW